MRLRHSAGWVVGAASVFTMLGCGPFIHLDRIEVLVDDAGNPRFAVEQSRAYETGRGPAERIVYGESVRGAWKVDSFVTPHARARGIVKLALDGEGRPVIAHETEGVAVRVRTSPHGWTEATLAETVSGPSRDVLRSGATLGGLWRLGSGDLSLLADRYVYRLHGTTLVEATDTGRSCSPHASCLFDAVGDRVGTAAMVDPRGTTLSLHCDDAGCSWSPERDLRVKGTPRSESIFFHTSDRTPLRIQPIQAPDYRESAIVAIVTPSEQSELATRTVYHAGGGRARGGAAVVTTTYEGETTLHLWREGEPARTIALGSFAPGSMSDPIAVADDERAGIETVHVLLVSGGDVVTHVRVDVASGRAVQTRIAIGEP